MITKYFITSLIIWNFICINGSISTVSKVKRRKLSECGSCKVLVKSFNYWLHETSRGKFEGGDAHWEENKLKTYSRSEVRLVEIQEGLCSELTKYKDECYAMNEKVEAVLEKWWNENDPTSEDLFSWLCVDTLPVCCPKDHYGPTCMACPTDCGDHARCDGDGTRQGSGECTCVRGWEMVDGICAAIDMCKADTCSEDEFCQSNEGSHICLKCHKNCKSCSGPNKKDCTKCAPNYMRSITGSCINTYLPVDNQFLSSFVVIISIIFVFLQILSYFFKSRYIYFVAFQLCFAAVHFYYGFMHMFIDFIYDIYDYANNLYQS